MSEFICTICDKVFSVNKNLRKHVREIHGVTCDSLDTYAPKVCLPTNSRSCVVCGELLSSEYESFEAHYRAHNIQLRKVHHFFESEIAFQQWKTTIEKETYAQFYKPRGSKNSKSGSQKYTFHCSRSGTYVPAGAGKRRLKIQGTKKIGGTCPASMNVSVHEDGTVNVQFIDTHVGHPIKELEHLRLSLRRDIAENLSKKIPKQVNSRSTSSIIERKKILLNNIMKIADMVSNLETSEEVSEMERLLAPIEPSMAAIKKLRDRSVETSSGNENSTSPSSWNKKIVPQKRFFSTRKQGEKRKRVKRPRTDVTTVASSLLIREENVTADSPSTFATPVEVTERKLVS